VSLYYVMMLAWVGCIADTAEVAAWFGDDIAFRADSYRVDFAGTLMPERMYFIDDSHATLDGADLGRPVRLRANPTIGEVPLPARGVLATGQAVFEILDPAEYERTRSQTAAAA
jgi:hypothetical protein